MVHVNDVEFCFRGYEPLAQATVRVKFL